jgi:hypothetical protein
MPLTLVTDGKDPLTAPARAYLERLGIPMHLVTRINVDSTHNRFQEVTVTLQVDTDLAANPNMVAVPLLGQTRDEWPRAMHRTCGHVHPPFTDCPPTEPAPGPDGDTRDWPTDTIPAVRLCPAHNQPMIEGMRDPVTGEADWHCVCVLGRTVGPVSHAPGSCAECGTLIRWNDAFGTWQHTGPDLDHEAVPSS